MSKIKDFIWALKVYLPRKKRFSITVLLVLVLGLPIALYSVGKAVQLLSKAQTAGADIYFSPSQSNIPPDAEVGVMLDLKSYSMGFAAVVVTFNPNQIHLSREVVTTTRMNTIVKKTSMAMANTTGRIEITLGLSPDDRPQPPTGVLEFARLTFRSATTTADVVSSLSIDSVATQLVSMTATEIGYTSQTGTFILNETVEPTVGPTETVVESPVPTVPAATPTDTPTLTSTLTPTETPAATPTDIPQPTTTNTTPTVPVEDIPTPSETVVVNKPGDVDGDGNVNIIDIGIIIDVYGQAASADARADLNRDGTINIVDIGIVIDNYGN